MTMNIKIATQCLLGLIASLYVLPVTQAALINYELTGTFTQSDAPASIAVGDRYTLSFTFDDDVFYSSLSLGANSTYTALFLNAISNASFEFEGTGSFADRQNINNLYLRLVQTGGFTFFQLFTDTPAQFGLINGQSVSTFELTLRNPDQFSFFFPPYSQSGDFVPNGFEVDQYLASPRRLTINTPTFFTTATVEGGAVAIPEPSAFAAIAGVGVLALAATRRRRRLV